MSQTLPTPADDLKLIQDFLTDRDVECPHCKYNLRNQKAAVCPECGQAIELGMRRAPVRALPALAALLSSLSLSTGLGLFLVVILAVNGRPLQREWFGFMYSLFSAAMLVPGLVLARRFTSAARTTQIFFISLAIANYVTVVLIWFFIIIR